MKRYHIKVVLIKNQQINCCKSKSNKWAQFTSTKWPVRKIIHLFASADIFVCYCVTKVEWKSHLIKILGRGGGSLGQLVQFTGSLTFNQVDEAKGWKWCNVHNILVHIFRILQEFFIVCFLSVKKMHIRKEQKFKCVLQDIISIHAACVTDIYIKQR